MADHNKPAAEKSFYSEILSPSELFAARSRSHKIPVRGQKDFFPDGSEEQRQKLEQSLAEHWSLLSEERVERLGNLVKAVWIPDDKIVELQSPAGKFWQTMGFSANGKQCLFPEEALYLMECGNLHVFYRDLPLSIQEGYERFLSADIGSLLQYQVFGHLKRLGYVVHRFDPTSKPSSYERQLNLPQSRDRAGRQQLKRKRSPSPAHSHTPTPTSSCSDTPQERRTEDKGEGSMEVQTSTSAPPGEGGDRSWWFTDALGGSDPGSDPGSEPGASSGSSRRDFSSIHFPDLGSSARAPRCLASPDPSLLPGALSVGECDVAPWRRRINLGKVSQMEQRREGEGHRWRRDVNQDKEVRRCRNWAEYQELMRRRQRRREGRPDHLWNREVTPLHDPRQPIPTMELLDKISVIKSTDLLEGASRLKGSDEWRISFSVYQPDSVADFKKSSPGKPYARMCVCSFDGPVPDLRVLKQLVSQSADTPVVFAVVDYGDISFYTFKDFQLPTDVHG